MQQQLLTLPEAAAKLKLSTVTLRAWAARRRIATVKLGRSVRVPEREIERLIEAGLTPASPVR